MKLVPYNEDTLLLEPVKIELSKIVTGGTNLILPDKKSNIGDLGVYRVLEGDLKDKIVVLQPYNVSEGGIYTKVFYTAVRDAIICFVILDAGETAIKI